MQRLHACQVKGKLSTQSEFLSDPSNNLRIKLSSTFKWARSLIKCMREYLSLVKDLHVDSFLLLPLSCIYFHSTYGDGPSFQADKTLRYEMI